MLKAIQKQHLFEPGSNLKAWLLTIMRNHFLAERRRAGRVVQDSDDMLAKTVAAQDNHAAAYEAKDVLSYLALVPLKMRRAVLMAAGGMQIDEIASREGVAEGTIKSRIHRGRTMLADLTGYEPTNLAETA